MLANEARLTSPRNAHYFRILSMRLSLRYSSTDTHAMSERAMVVIILATAARQRGICQAPGFVADLTTYFGDR
jgi:hypothetical protein